jgi:hypothetical protein
MRLIAVRLSPGPTSVTARSVWDHGSPHGKTLTLPKSIESGNLIHNEAVMVDVGHM